MKQLLNWWWYRKYSSSPACSAAAHQSDIYNWFFDAIPTAVIASGDVGYYKHRKWYDNVLAIYEYARPEGTSRVSYNVLTTNSSVNRFEKVMGIEGWMALSEDPEWQEVRDERSVATSSHWHDQKCVDEIVRLTPSEELLSIEYKIHLTLDKTVHQPHLENFFGAIRTRVPLNCPAAIGHRTTVSVLKINEAVTAHERLTFKPDDFVV